MSMIIRVRIKSIVAGPGIQAQPGDVLGLDPKQASQLVQHGYAEYDDRREPADEVAIEEPPEQAVTRKAPARRTKARTK